MALLKFLRLLLSQPLADLSAESLNQQTATHADAAMNTPHSQEKPNSSSASCHASTC